MFIDARSLPSNTMIESDVSIVGAGAAGITLAREFIGQGFRVCLLESGGLDFNGDTQSLAEGESVGQPYVPIGRGTPPPNSLAAVRLRYFGGTSNHWGGWCRPLDEIDFEARDWVPYSGWPFNRVYLDQFYRRAHSICELGPAVYEVGAWESKEAPRLPFAGDRVLTKMFQLSPPTRFGQTYRPEISQADNVHAYLHANLVTIEASKNAKSVSRLHVATLQGNKFWVSGRLFILAAGGIENPRLLLLSNNVQGAGLGNENDLVGRFFMEHQELLGGLFLPSNPNILTGLYVPHRVSTDRVWGRVTAAVTLSRETMRREKLPNFAFEVEPVASPETGGVASVRSIRRSLGRGQMPDGFMKHLRNVIADFDDVSAAAYRKLVGYSSARYYRLMNASEQIPNRESRVTLSGERDRLGKKQARLDWRLSAMDRQGLSRGYEIVAQEFGRAGLGRVRITVDEEVDARRVYGQCHLMGATRMHSDPRQGVVNANCRVHGISNLFIAGSSVFPTSGSASPTLTIVALAVRLADHVKGLMR